MPDPLIYSIALGLAMIASAALVLVIGWFNQSYRPARINQASLLGIGLGLVLGCAVLGAWPGVPPATAMERLLVILFPAVLLVELLASISNISPIVAWFLRLIVALGCGRILLHGSVYLSGPYREWTNWQSWQILAVCALVLIVEWALLSRLSRHPAGSSISLALALSIQCAGISTMLAGYIKGGAAAIPMVGTLVGVVMASSLFNRTVQAGPNAQNCHSGTIGTGLIGLFALLFIGRFFGRLGTPEAVTMMLAPLICWITEIPLISFRNSRIRGIIRLGFVAIPLVIVLILAKREFDQHMAPLL